MTTDYKMQVVAPFSPLIMKAVAPVNLVSALNAQIDDIVATQAKRDERDWSKHLAGNLAIEVRLTDIIKDMPEATAFLYDVARTYTYRCENLLLHYGNYEHTDELADKKLEIQIKEGWSNDMVAGDFNPVHYHQGCVFSCVLFLRVPEGYEAEFQADKHRQNTVGCLQFIDSRTAVGTRNLFVIKPVVGDFYLWPSWMLHCVYPFRGDGIRRSMSVNLGVL
ncbi:MAG: putative 2OG-Fe(II) oxygenase [Asticcacaulis sp.]